MKKLIGTIFILLFNSASAATSDIVASVNDKPITRYDIISRKNLITALNSIDNSDPTTDAKLNNSVMNLLIDEELLNQYAESTGNEVSIEQVNEAIGGIEQANNMQSGEMRDHLNSRGLSMDSFKKQIRGEIIKRNIISLLSGSISVSQSELNTAIANDSKPEFNIDAWIFTSKSKEENDKKQMQDLRKKLRGCDNVDPSSYENFADAKKISRQTNNISPSTLSIIHDTKEGTVSSLYKEDNRFKLVLVCKKHPAISINDLNKMKSLLSNKKMSKKAAKFFKDMKTKADIRIISPD